MYIKNEKLIYQNYDGCVIVYDILEKNKIYENASTAFINHGYNHKDKYLRVQSETQIDLLDLRKKDLGIKKILGSFLICFQDTFFINYDFHSLTCYSSLDKLTDGIDSWRTNLTAFGKVVNILGKIDAKLWVWCENYIIVCLDTDTGEVNYAWQPFKGVFEDGQFYFNFPYFDEKNCKVLFFERSYFIECDLQTQTTHIIWQDDKVNLNIIACSFTSDFLYFVAANRGRVVDRILGVFDIKLCGKRN